MLSGLALPDLAVLRHDVRGGSFTAGSFDLVHVRAVLMRIADRMAVLRRVASWLAPGSWLVAGKPAWACGPAVTLPRTTPEGRA